VAVPVRDDGRPGPDKRLLVFVHGFLSDASTWDPLVSLLQQDSEIQSQFVIERFNYRTGVAATPFVERLPTISEIAQQLDTWLSSRLFEVSRGENRYIDVTLTGHSMGGLVIQMLLTRMLEQGRGKEFQFIRQAMFFATPHLGSMTLEGVRGFLGALMKNPQEEMLRGLNQQVAELHQRMEERILRALRREDARYPLPCTCFWGLEDNIVPEISARGFFPVMRALPGNHFTLHCPASEQDSAYREYVEALEHPHGHEAIFEIEQFRYAAQVRPVTAGTRREVRHGHAQRVVETDNEALDGVTIRGGGAWTYVAVEEYLWRRPSKPPEAIIRRTYLEILARGHAELGEEFQREYEATTDPVPDGLVVNDFR
jgi:pimeloyl-ACP methyl ester carboxylesterase